ncbi:hypothetical protein ACC689_29055 [Rhizobium ruizarguesonis]
MSAIGNMVRYVGGLLLILATATPAQAMSPTQLGARQLTATSASVDLARLHNELCDILASVHEIDGRARPCDPPCAASAGPREDQCKEVDTFDLAPSAKLLLNINDSPRQALLDFIRMAGLFCETNGVVTDPEALQKCWNDIPIRLEELRLAGEALYTNAAGAEGGGTDDTSRVARTEGERAVAAVAALGQSWGWQQRPKPDAVVDGLDECGDQGVERPVPKELIDAIHQMAEINTGPKMQRAEDLFPELRQAIDDVLGVLNSKQDTSAKEMDRLCKFAAAVDARTNSRLANYYINPTSGGELSDKAKLVHDHRDMACSEHLPADEEGLCAVEPGDYAVAFSDYIRASLSSWNNADLVVKIALPKIRDRISVRLAQDKASSAVKTTDKGVRLAVVAANLMAGTFDQPRDANGGAKEETVADEGRSHLSLLLARLIPPKRDEAQPAEAGACAPLRVSAVLKDAETLSTWLTNQLKVIDDAKGTKGDATTKAATADEVRNGLIKEARAWLGQALPDNALAAIRKATDQLTTLSDHLTIGELSDSGNGLILAAMLQRACEHDGKIDIEMAFNLVPNVTETAKVSAESISGVPFILPLRRSLLVSLDVFEFQSGLLDGTLETSLTVFVKQNMPADFAADLSELCSLPAALSSAPNAAAQVANCRWPAAIQLPARAQISFSPDVATATITLPDWLQTIVPPECSSSITIGKGNESVQRLISCFSQDLKANVLSAMLGQRFAQLQDTATKKLDDLNPASLKKLIEDAGLKDNNACRPKLNITLTAVSKNLAAIHQSIQIRPAVDDKGNLVPLPADPVPLLKVEARLAIDDCLKSQAAQIPSRFSGIWTGASLQWSQTLEVKLPRFGANVSGGSGAPDPLDAWVEAIAALGQNAETPMFVWDRPAPSQESDLDRNLAASALLASDHLELCKTSDGSEELRFYFSPLSANGGLNDAPCSPVRPGNDAPLLLPLVVATGSNYQSLIPAPQLATSVIGPLTAKFASSVALHLADAKLDFGAAPDLSDDAKSCATNLASTNRLSFDIDNSTFDTGAVGALPLLHVIVGWEPGKPASLTLLADKPIDQVGKLIASVAHLDPGDVKVMGFAVAGGDVKPCVISPTPAVLTAKLGSAFVEELLSSDVADKLGTAAEIAGNLNMLASFIRSGQPWTRDQRPLKEASKALLLQLQSCSGKAKDHFVTCDYTIAIGGCPIRLRIDETHQSLTFKGKNDLKLPSSCAPETLGMIFAGDGTSALPFTLSDPALTISDKIEFSAQLTPAVDTSSAAVNACLARLDLAQQTIRISANSAGAMSLAAEPSAKKALTDCAIDYAAGKVADGLLSAGLDANVLTDRVNQTIQQWFETSNKAMQATCESISAGPVLICKAVTVAEAAKTFTSDWSTASVDICNLVATPIDSALGDKAGMARNHCIDVLAGKSCTDDPSQEICKAVIGFKFEANFDLPGGQRAKATVHYLPPKKFVTDSCFGNSGPLFKPKYLDIAVTPNCKDGVLGLVGTISLASDFPLAVSGTPVPVSAPISLSANLLTGSVSANIKGPNWQGILSAALSRAIKGKKLEASGSTIEVTDVVVDSNNVATIKGTLMFDYGEHIELPGFTMTVNLKSGDVAVTAPDASAAARGLFERLASSVSIPGVLSINPESPVFENGKFKSISAKVTVQGGVFQATLPPMIFDSKGVRFGDPFSITLVFKAQIPIPPLALTNIRGTISEKFLSLGADATFGEATLAYLVKATGDFTLPFDLHDNITAIEQMIVFTVIPLGKSTTTINIHGPLLSRTIEIGGALKPIIWLFGRAKLEGKKITGNTNFALFGIDLAHSDLDADLGSGQVSATGSVDIGIGNLGYKFNGKQFTDNMRLQMNGNIKVGKFSLSRFNILATPSSAAVKFKVLGISLGFVTPRIKDINSDMLEKMIEKLFSLNLKDLAKALEAILSGNLTINPYSHFGKDAGNGVASGDASGSEGGVDGEDGSSAANGGGATGAVPGAAAEAAKQTPQSKGNQEGHDQADAKAKAETVDLKQKATDKGAVKGASKPLLNPEGDMVMQFALASNGAEQTIVGDLLRPGQVNTAPILVLKKGEEPKTFFTVETAPQLAIVPTPVLLERDLFVASEASMAPFLPKDHRNQDASPIQGLCQGNVTELDLLLFANNTDASAPKRLPAGLLGLCLEGLKGLATKHAAYDLLVAGLHAAAATLPTWPEREIKDKASVSAPLKAAWFQCESRDNKGTIAGLSMLVTGELASRIILHEPDGLLRYFTMSGFPYGVDADDAKRRVAACLLLDQANPKHDGKPFDLITLRDATGVLIAGRSPDGEFEFNGSKWGTLKFDDDHPVPPIVPLITPPDLKDEQIREAIKHQNDERESRSKDGGPTKMQVNLPGGHNLCVVNQSGSQFLAVREGQAKRSFMQLLSNDSFTFASGGAQLIFPPVASNTDPDGCSIPSDPAPIVIFDDATPGIGRMMRGDSNCALDFYWQDGVTGNHSGFGLSSSICAAAKAASTVQMIFNHDMFWVISPFMFCMDDNPAHKTACVPDGLKVGGGWSDKNRVVVATAPRGDGVKVWAGPIEIGRKPGTSMNGDAGALDDFIRREWTSPQLDVFADWFGRNTSALYLLPSTPDHLDFMAASSVLRINLSGTPLKTEIDFIAAPGLLTDETIRRVLATENVIPLGQEVVKIALISDKDGAVMFAVQAGAADQQGTWELWKNGTKMAAILAGLNEADLVPGLSPALDKLINNAAQISIYRNVSSLLVANGSAAFVADQTGACVQPLLGPEVEEKIRQALVGLWTKDFSKSSLKTKAPCNSAAVAIAPRTVPAGDPAFTVVDYPALVLNRLPASHVLANGRTMTVLHRADISKDFRDAEDRTVSFGLKHPDLGDQLELLGEIGKDKVRFAFKQHAGLAGPKFACPFDDAAVFSHPSVVLNEYLASIDKQCQEAQQISGVDIRFSQIGSSHGAIDVVTAPNPDQPGTWSVFLGDGKGSPGAVQSASVTLPTNANAEDRANELEGLAHSWTELGTKVGRGGSFTLRLYPSSDCTNCLAVVTGDDKSRVLAATLSGPAAHQFWQLGDAEPIGDPFDGLDQATASVAANILRSDLERVSAAGGSHGEPAPAFCVIKATDATLWPNLTADGTDPYEQRYHGIAQGKETALINVVSSDTPSCKSLQSSLGAGFHSNLKVVELVKPPNDNETEVWLADDVGPDGTTYARRGAACDLHSGAGEVDTFNALRTRPHVLDCPRQVFKQVITEAKDAAPRLVMTGSQTDYGSIAWIDGPNGFRAIGLIDATTNYSEGHWRLINDTDLSVDPANRSLALALGNLRTPNLVVVRPDGEITSRAPNQDPRRVRTIGFPKTISDQAVLSALKRWATSAANAQGLVFPSGGRVAFWMVDGLQRATLFEQKPGSMWVYPVSIESSSLDLDGLMSALHNADQRVLDAIEERSADQFTATLRIAEVSLVLIGQHRLVLQTGAGDSPSVQTATFDTAPSSGSIEEIVAALRSDASICGAEKPCVLLLRTKHFALLDGTAVILGGGNKGKLGHATIVAAEGMDVPALVGRVLDTADEAQLATESGIVVPIGDGEGLLADGKAGKALFFDPRQFLTLSLRPALTKLPSEELAAKFLRREPDFVSRLMGLGETSSIGMVNGRDLFACTSNSLVLFDGGQTGTVTAPGGIEPFCSAIETSSFHFDGDIALSLIPHNRAFLLFKPTSDGGFKVRLWRAGDERTPLDLPFSPAELPRPSLRSDVLDAALDCVPVEQVVKDGSGLALIGTVAPWECTIRLGGADSSSIPLSGPTLLLEHAGAKGAPSVIASVTILPGAPPRGTSQVLEALATRVLAICKDKTWVSAESREATTLVSLGDGCGGVVAWLPKPDDQVQTISGDPKQARSLWLVLGTQVAGLKGNDLHLDAFIEGKGAVVSEAGLLTVAPLNDGPVGRASTAVEAARDAVCDRYAIGAYCKEVLAVDIAKAALAAKGLDGGRRIPYARDPDGLVWPENVWDFWVGIAN